MFKNNPLFFINFLFFFNIQFKYLKKLCFAENTIKIVFFRKTQLFRNTVSKTHFFNHVKKHTFFKEKCVIFWFWTISVETPIFIVFLLYTVLVQKILVKTDSCNENALFFSPFLTQIVSGNFC